MEVSWFFIWPIVVWCDDQKSKYVYAHYCSFIDGLKSATFLDLFLWSDFFVANTIIINISVFSKWLRFQYCSYTPFSTDHDRHWSECFFNFLFFSISLVSPAFCGYMCVWRWMYHGFWYLVLGRFLLAKYHNKCDDFYDYEILHLNNVRYIAAETFIRKMAPKQYY